MPHPVPVPNSAPADAVPAPVVFDGSVLSDFLGPDAAVQASVLKTFVTSMGDSMAALRTALLQEQLDAVATLAHRTKGAAFMSGALALAQAAQTLEQTARAGNRPSTLQAAAVLELQWQTLQDNAHLKSTLAGG